MKILVGITTTLYLLTYTF